ncbi:MAG TPA: hypothetical protein VFG31_09565 [Conexibacter sp.]|nr:hypothetical protein [Conexibacter sp.]
MSALLTALLLLCACSIADADLIGATPPVADTVAAAGSSAVAGAATVASSAGSAAASATTPAVDAPAVTPPSTPAAAPASEPAAAEPQAPIERATATVGAATTAAGSTVDRVISTAGASASVGADTVRHTVAAADASAGRTTATVAGTLDRTLATTAGAVQRTTQTVERIGSTATATVGQPVRGAAAAALATTVVDAGATAQTVLGTTTTFVRGTGTKTTFVGATAQTLLGSATTAPAEMSRAATASTSPAFLTSPNAAAPTSRDAGALAAPVAPLAARGPSPRSIGEVDGWIASHLLTTGAVPAGDPSATSTRMTSASAVGPTVAHAPAADPAQRPVWPPSVPGPLSATSPASGAVGGGLVFLFLLATVAVLSGPRRAGRLLPASRALRPQPFVLLPERPG